MRKFLQLGRTETTISEEDGKPKKKGGRDFLVILGLASELGFSIAIPIGGGVLLGSFIDKQTGTAPLFTLLLLLLGVIFGMFNLYNIVQQTTKKDKK